MTITAKRLQYLLFIEGVYVPAANLSFNNTTGQPCTLTASIPPHPFCYGLRRGMYVHLFKKVNDEDPVLRFSGMLMNKVYGKSGEGRDLRIECASPEIRLTSIKMCEVDSNSLAMMDTIQIGYIKMMEGLSARNIKVNNYSDFISLYKESKANNSSNKDKNPYDDIGNIINSDTSLGADLLKKGWRDGADTIISKSYNSEQLNAKNKAIQDILSGQPDPSWSKDKQNAFKQMRNSLGSYRFKEAEIEREKKTDDNITKAELDYNKAFERFSKAEKDYNETNFINRTGLNVFDATKAEYDTAKKNKEKAKKVLDDLKAAKGKPDKERLESTFNQALEKFVGDDKDNPLYDMKFEEAMAFAQSNAAYESLKNTVETAKKTKPQYLSTSNTPLGNQVNVAEGTSSDAYRNIQTTTISTSTGKGEDKNKEVTETLQQIVNPTLARRFTQIANDCKNDYMLAIVEFIKEVYKKNNEPLVREEALHFNILQKMGSSAEYIKALDVIDWGRKVSYQTEVQQNTGHHFAPIAFTLATTINTLIKGSDAGVPMMELVQQMLNTLLASYSTIHTQLDGGMVVHPMMCNYFPPCRNVIFPGMMSSVQYNANDWANPTRTYMLFQSYLQPAYEINAYVPRVNMPHRIATAPKEARQLRYINYEIIDQTNEQYNKSVKSMVDSDKDNKEETKKEGASAEERVELMKSVNGFNIVNSHFTDEEEEIGRTINIVNYGMGVQFKTSDPDQIAMADMYHGMARYGCRSCVVTGGDELDDLVVGMPVVVLDHVYSIYGVVESLSFSVMGEGNVQSSVTISMPRMPLLNKYDNLTHAGMWFDTDKSRPSNIGKAYESILGEKESFYDKCKKQSGNTQDPALEDRLVKPPEDTTDNMDDDTVTLVSCIARLNNKYIMAEDKREYVRNFRNVQEVRYSEVKSLVREDIYRADPVKYYVEALGIQSDDFEGPGSHKYACVTPDSLNYSDQGYISLNIQNTGSGDNGQEQAFYLESQYRANLIGKDTNIYSPDSETSKKIKEGIKTSGGLQEKSLNNPIKNGIRTSAFGSRIHPKTGEKKYHGGVDIGVSGNTIGTPISVVSDGVVEYVGDSGVLGYGKYVKINHGNGFSTLYAHCDTINVKKGQAVEAGQKIAGMGNTGTTNKSAKSNGAHLHFEIWKDGDRVDPDKYLKS